MSNKKSSNMKKDILFLGKKTAYPPKTKKEKFKKNKFLINNNINNLTKPDEFSDNFDKKFTEQSLNFNGSNYICQDCLNSHKEKNEFFENYFCFICGKFVRDNEFNYLINPLQKIALINELKKYGIILSEKKEEKLSFEEQKYNEIRICKNCHLAYFKIIKPFLKLEYDNNIIKLKDNNKNPIENPIKKEVSFSEMSNNNYSNEIINPNLFNNNISNNIDIKLKDNSIDEKINIKSIIDNNNNFNNISNIDFQPFLFSNINQVKEDFNSSRHINELTNNYLGFINSINKKTVNTDIGNNNLYTNIKNLNSNNIFYNLNEMNNSNNLNNVPRIPSIIQNSSNNNINELNNINIFQNLNRNIYNNSYKEDVINKKNDDVFLNYIDMIQELNAQNIKQNNILINDNYNKYVKLNQILQLITKYFVKYGEFNMESKFSLINDIELLTNIFSQILVEFNLKKNADAANKKLSEENNNDTENQKMEEKNDEDKSFKKENPPLNIDTDYELYMREILKVKENIKFKLNAMKIYSEIKNEYILTLFKNIESIFKPSQNIIQNQENNPLFNKIIGNQINNESNSNFKLNDFTEKNINDLYNNIYNNLFQNNKANNNQDLLSLFKQINLPNSNLNFGKKDNNNNNNNLNGNFPA